MKKYLGLFLVLIALVVMLTGCLEGVTTQREKIEGTAYNKSDYRVELKFKTQAGLVLESGFIASNSSKDFEIEKPGSFEVYAYDADSGDVIGSDTLATDQEDTYFVVQVYNTTVHAYAN